MDLELPETEIIRIYGKRWDVEFFKVIKPNLKLAKEFRASHTIWMNSHITIVCLRYLCLLQNRVKTLIVVQSAGMFYDCCDEIQDIKLAIDSTSTYFEFYSKSVKSNFRTYGKQNWRVISVLFQFSASIIPTFAPIFRVRKSS